MSLTDGNTNNKKTIGIPRGLLYYEHGAIWKSFFEQLDFNVIISSQTNSKILSAGVMHCTNETCLPVKVYHGHILDLNDKADYIFVPRYSSIYKNEYSCPKLCGLPDMATYNLKSKPKILEIKINENKKNETYDSLKSISAALGVSYQKILTVYQNTIDRHLNNMDESFLRITPPINKKKIAILGHNYMIFDEYLSMDLINKISRYGYYACTPDIIQPTIRRTNAYPYNGDLKAFYSSGLDNLGGLYSLLNSWDLSGIIYLTPFACGVDSVVVEFIERGLKERKHIPFLKLTIDEHTGEAGFDTRLEAFIDMVV